ncbi:MAG: hypothetical protein HQM09_10385 [Candidatus Riflebacteria bacterium]|nr:hypothetical protein [Candidatus Riflebacteria bacterium]
MKRSSSESALRFMFRSAFCGFVSFNLFSSLFFLILTAGMFIVLPDPATAKPAYDDELIEIREDISLLNLLRGLYLSPTQIDGLIDMANKAKSLRDNGKAQFQGVRADMVKSFANLRDSLFLSPGNEKKAQDAASAFDKNQKDGVGKIQDGIALLEEAATGILSSAQQAIVENFKPCLIPPKDLRNPVRVGQAAGELGILGKVADLIHAAPNDLWRVHGESLLNKITSHMEQESGEMNSVMRDDTRKRLGVIAGEIRGLSDVDFTLRREKLAQELQLINPQKALHHGHRKTGPVAQFLLSDTAAELLPRWKKAIAALPKAASAIEDDAADDMAVDADIRKKGEQAIKSLTNMYNARRKTGRLPEVKAFLAPVHKSVDSGNLREMVVAFTGAAEKLTSVSTGIDLTRIWKQIVRLTNRVSELPLLNREYDPFGFAADFEIAQNETDPDKACHHLQSIAQNMQKFLR